MQLVSESPELRAPEQNTATELKPINNPPARPAPHPICLLIPSADDDELQDLTDDIRAHGLIAPIVLFEGMILDGRNRAAACERAGIAPRYVQFEGGREDALILVVSHNLKRRHLTKQAIADALVAAEDFNLHYTLVEPAAAAEAAADGPEAQSVIKITEPKTASSRKLAQAAGRVVSHVMIAATRKVKEKGEPELQEAVKKGRIGVQDAAKAADLPPEQQKAIAGSPKPRRAAAEAAEAAKNALTRWWRCSQEATWTGTLRCKRRGRGRRRCAAYGRRRTTEPRNGLSARFCSIRTRVTSPPGTRPHISRAVTRKPHHDVGRLKPVAQHPLDTIDRLLDLLVRSRSVRVIGHGVSRLRVGVNQGLTIAGRGRRHFARAASASMARSKRGLSR